jgi:transposase
MLQPVVRRTWAPRGQTPIHYSWDRHDRLSVILALTLSPERHRHSLYFDLYGGNFDGELLFQFFLSLVRTIRKPVVLIMDRLSAHKTAVRLLHEHLGDRADRIQVEWLPAYAPDLNPVEAAWGHCKHSDLANFIPEDIHDLEGAIHLSMEATRGEHSLIRAFFKKSGLEV